MLGTRATTIIATPSMMAMMPKERLVRQHLVQHAVELGLGIRVLDEHLQRADAEDEAEHDHGDHEGLRHPRTG